MNFGSRPPAIYQLASFDRSGNSALFDDKRLFSLHGSPPLQSVEGSEPESILSLAHGTKITAVRMMKLRVGPGIELFEMKGPTQADSVRPSDFGLQHFALYVDDIDAAIAQFEKAGSKMYTRPQALMFPTETGKGNFFRSGRIPWGPVVEFISLPSPLP